MTIQLKADWIKVNIQITLNDNEKAVLQAIIDNARDCSGGDFAIGGEIAAYVPQLKPRQVAGFISKLQSKGFISVSGPAGAVDSQIEIHIRPDGAAYRE